MMFSENTGAGGQEEEKEMDQTAQSQNITLKIKCTIMLQIQ